MEYGMEWNEYGMEYGGREGGVGFEELRGEVNSEQ
jgi:hypothetical protein